MNLSVSAISFIIYVLFVYGSGSVLAQGNISQNLQQPMNNQSQSQINQSQTQGNQTTGNIMCDSSYPDFCLSTDSARLMCSDFPYRNFTVLAPDTHGLDSDGDGLGCESNVTTQNSNLTNLTNKSSNLNTTIPEQLPPESVNGSKIGKI
ncbi:hypothetical protein BH18THE1_BH18THE1_14350 [soil metagenome]